jgi:hypothetical protein
MESWVAEGNIMTRKREGIAKTKTRGGGICSMGGLLNLKG